MNYESEAFVVGMIETIEWAGFILHLASGVYENKAPELVMSVVNTKHACDLLVDFAFTTEVFITTIIDNIDIKIRTFQVDNSRTAEIFKNNYWCY